MQWWRSNEGELALAMATAEALGAMEARQLCARTKEEQKLEMRRGMDREGAGGVKAALWLVTAALGRTPATHGQFPRHTAASA